MTYGIWFMYVILLIIVEQTKDMLVSCPKALQGARNAWTSDFDSWDLQCHSPEYPAQQATRTSYLLANTDECCKLQKRESPAIELATQQEQVVATVKSVKNNF